MLGLGELEVKRKCALVRSSDQTFPVSSAAVPHCYSVSHHYEQFSHRVGRSARCWCAGHQGWRCPRGRRWCRPVSNWPTPKQLGTPVAPCRSLSVTLLKGLGVTFTAAELGGGEHTLGV